MLKTNLPTSITSIDEAKKFLTELHLNGEGYHPEDDANDCLSHIASFDEGTKLNFLMSQIYELMNFDPCEFILDSNFDKLVEINVINYKNKGGKSSGIEAKIVRGYLLGHEKGLTQVKLIEAVFGYPAGHKLSILQSQILVK